ncbi:MAG: PQQ-binding-like beta-propeller repeat protein [Gammaproteobacteria bacterium]|nr:PQQ-binding-like beta-propeller repeat protein [Gammaproteobacteria bacterium]
MKTVVLISTLVAWLCSLVPASAAGPGGEGADPAASLGQQVYETYCASCHGQKVARAPDAHMLKLMTADSVLNALNDGVMVEQAEPLHADERKAVAEYLTGKLLGQENTDPGLSRCIGIDFDADDHPVVKDWGIDHANTRNQSTASAGLSDAAPANLEIAWSIAFPGAVRVRSQPAFAGGYLLLGSQDGAVYALDAASGCQHWKFQAVSEVRTSVAVSQWADEDENPQPVAIFGDYLGNVYGVNARTGSRLWKVRPHDHPHATITGTPRILNEVAYVAIASHEDGSAVRPDYPCCSFRGAVAAVEVNTGKTIWLTHTIAEAAIPRDMTRVGTRRWGSSGAASWTTPAIDAGRRQLYIGTGDNYSGPATATSDSVIAMDIDSGEINWIFQATAGDTWNGACMQAVKGPNCPEPEGPDYDIGASVIVATRSDGKDIVLAGQKSGAVFALDPDSGKLIWKRKPGRGGIQGGIHFGMAVAGDLVYVPVSDMAYPSDAQVYSEPPAPGLYALNTLSGDTVWQWRPTQDTCHGRRFCDPGLSAPPTVIGDYVLAGGLDGWLRVHDRHTGRIVWSLDTTLPVKTINGVPGRGGSLNGLGAVARQGLIYLASGYGIYDHMPGNVLLVLRERR